MLEMWGREEGGGVLKGCLAAKSTLERLRKSHHTLRIKASGCQQGCSGFAPLWLQCPELSAQMSVKVPVFSLDSEL